ncbi:hypothetical protein ACOME3_002101 [Neoechinorhynchus agilis]
MRMWHEIFLLKNNQYLDYPEGFSVLMMNVDCLIIGDSKSLGLSLWFVRKSMRMWHEIFLLKNNKYLDHPEGFSVLMMNVDCLIIGDSKSLGLSLWLVRKSMRLFHEIFLLKISIIAGSLLTLTAESSSFLS